MKTYTIKVTDDGRTVVSSKCGSISELEDILLYAMDTMYYADMADISMTRNSAAKKVRICTIETMQPVALVVKSAMSCVARDLIAYCGSHPCDRDVARDERFMRAMSILSR